VLIGPCIELPGTLEACFVPETSTFRFPGTSMPYFMPGIRLAGQKHPILPLVTRYFRRQGQNKAKLPLGEEDV
jgi:hypothetical protein